MFHRPRAQAAGVAIVALLLLGPARAGAAPLPPVARVTAPVVERYEHGPVAPDPAGRVGLRFTDAAIPSTTDAADAVSGEQTHVIYFVPKDQESRSGIVATLTTSINAIRSWFERETDERGAALRPRMDITADGSYDISTVTGAQNSAEYDSMEEIVEELIGKGFDQSNKRYLIYSETSADAPNNPGGVCGEGYYPLPGFAVRQYALVHLLASDACGSTRFATSGTADGARRSEAIAVHEWLHNEGIAPLSAPRYCATSMYHICTGPLWVVPQLDTVGYLDPENVDVMFPIITTGLASKDLDLGRDDYLDHGLPTQDLRSSRWLEPA